MMNGANILIGYISSFCEIALAAYFLSAFKEKRFSAKIMCAIAIAVSTVYGTVLNFVPVENIVFIFSIIATFLVSLCYKFKWYVALFMSLIFSALSGMFELVVMQITVFGGGDFKETINNNIFVYICGLIAAKLLVYLTIIIIRKSGHKSFQSIKGTRFFGLLMLPSSTAFISLVCSHLMLDYDLSYFWKIFSIISLVLLIISNIMIFYIVDREYELISTKEQLKASKALLENQKQYYEDIFQSQKEIRKTRHDLKNIFIAMLGELNAGRINETKQLVQNKLAEMEQYIDVSNSTNNMIDSVVYSKFVYAKQNQIKLEIHKNTDRPIKIDHLDLAVLIANILDNAIEATMQVPNNKHISFSLITDNDNIVILTQNPTVNDIDTTHLMTTKKDKKHHGFGLMSVKSIAQKYNGNYVFECADGIFTSTIVLFNHQIGISK